MRKHKHHSVSVLYHSNKTCFERYSLTHQTRLQKVLKVEMSLSKPKRKASEVSPGASVNVDIPGKEIPPSVQNTMGDVPPEVLTMILEYATLNNKPTNILGFREITSQWRDIVNPVIEKKIIAGEFPVSPRMKIFSVGRKYNQLHVRFSTDSFPPLLFNSLLLSGDKKVADIYDDAELPHSRLTLPILTTRFGGSLTSFGLHDQIIPLKSLVAMLSSMPNLKLINLKDTKFAHYDIKAGAVLPIPPPLPNLSTLELKSTGVIDFHASRLSSILYVWLIVSYSEQLVHLVVILETDYPFPALQKAHQYSHNFANGKLCKIATSSESSFDNLKRLQIFNPTAEFQELSETPGLKHLSVIRQGGWLLDHFEELVRFIIKNRSTLQSVCVDRIRNGPSCHPKYFSLGQGLQTILGGVELPKLTTLSFPYPTSDAYEKFLSKEFIPLFPSLKVLHLLHFTTQEFAEDMKVNIADENDDAYAVTLKARLPPIWQLINDLDQKVKAAYEKQGALIKLQHQMGSVDEPTTVPVLQQMVELNRAIIAARNERTSIFQRLAGMGENMGTLMVEELLQMGGFWGVCVNLQMVSASSGGKPDGDICVIQRNVDA